MGEKRILIVEDDADISMIEEAYLNTAGLETKIVSEGSQVVPLLEKGQLYTGPPKPAWLGW